MIKSKGILREKIKKIRKNENYIRPFFLCAVLGVLSSERAPKMLKNAVLSMNRVWVGRFGVVAYALAVSCTLSSDKVDSEKVDLG